LVLDVEMSNCAKEEVSSISSWDKFKSIQRNPRQNSNYKKGALRIDLEKDTFARSLFLHVNYYGAK
jgi:hypothetical protein